MHQLAKTIVDLLNTEAMINAKLPTVPLCRISRFYNEAKMAMDVTILRKSVIAHNKAWHWAIDLSADPAVQNVYG